MVNIILLFLILGGIVTWYFYLTRNYNYWRDRGIPCAKGILPGFGNTWLVTSLKMNLADFTRRIYESHSDCSMIGFYDKTVPALMVREPELVKTVVQTDFASFSENLLKLDPHLDPLLSLNPFFSAGKVWHTYRKRFIHAFSGMKLKLLFNYIEQVYGKFEDYLDQQLQKGGTLEVELKELFSRYTGEAVANAGFSVEGFCFENETRSPTRTSFHAIGQSIFQSNFFTQIVQSLNFFLPELNRIFRMPFVPRWVDQFFRDTVEQILQLRQQENERRSDFLQVMIDLEEKDEDGRYNIQALAAHVLGLFMDGYETTSITLSFIGYQLARHPSVLQRLRDEVETVLVKYDNRLTYESLKEMTYMDQVISESQRFYSALATMGKICTQEFELVGSDGLRCRVQPGMPIMIPVHELHRDSKYWPDPDAFNPDRFAADKKEQIERYTFLPFGEGPRMCAGMRMGMMMMKSCLATLVRRYTLELSPKTQEPLKMQPGNFFTIPIGGLWVHIKRL